MVECYLSLGSNQGNKKAYLTEAINMLNDHPAIKLIKTASFYKTKPVGDVVQDDFLNTVAAVETSLDPRALLKAVNLIENQLGRKRLIRWGPRTVDIDILTYGQENVNESDLIIPHQEMMNRGFVLVPLLEICPDFVFPSGETGREVLSQLEQKKGCLGVEKVI